MATLPELDLARMLRALDDAQVEYVVIGGIAAVHHGSPFPTEDVDITPRRSEANLERLSRALRVLQAKIRSEGTAGLAFSHTGASLGDVAVWNLVTDAGALDISFVPNGTEGYEDLIRDASKAEIAKVQVRVASLADVIRSKQAANRPKDQRVLPTLREILASRHRQD